MILIDIIHFGGLLCHKKPYNRTCKDSDYDANCLINKASIAEHKAVTVHLVCSAEAVLQPFQSLQKQYT